MSDLGMRGLDDLMDKTRDALQSVSAGRGPVDGATGSGEAAGGLVRASAAAGRLQSLHLGPEAMRMTARDLAAAIESAVNQALDAQGAVAAGYVGETAGLENVDARVLADRVAEIQEMGVRQMREIGQAIADVMAQMRRGAS
jgi:hypothetical protein